VGDPAVDFDDVANVASAAWSCWPAPAKLNLFLHIVGRRDDGYHRLQTAFQLLDWGDAVRLRVRTDGVIARIDPLPGVADDADLGVRAANALRAATGCALGADIAIDKRIPIGGGLGGGSSDAASVLVALNALWRTGLDDDELATIGLTLGADVPLFVRGRSAWAEGVGERLTPIALPERWFVVVDPGVAVPTRELFQVPELTRNSPPLTIPLFVSGAATGNAFESVVRRRFPEVDAAFAWLGRHGEARLSGSGGAVFAPFASHADGSAALGDRPAGMRAWVVRGVDASPLHRRLEAWRGEAADHEHRV
jgi:4-diphosphocytidyl-2-C-methyl-D-erythritol kinase